MFLESVRNYTILSIICEETMWFNSKEKSPILLFFEIFRLEETLENNKFHEDNNPNNKIQELGENIVDKKLSLISNFNYLYFDYILSRPICLQV